MTPDDDGLECVGIAIATRAHLAALGFAWRWPFAVCMARRDGVLQQVACETLGGVAELVATLNPRDVELTCAPNENRDALLQQITGRADDPGTALLH